MSKTPKKTISKEIRANQFMLIYFSRDNTWTICKNEKGLFREKNEKIMVRDAVTKKWFAGKIKMIGTEDQCKEYGEKRYENGEFFSSDNEVKKVEESPERVVSHKSKNASTKMDVENKKYNDLLAIYGDENVEEEISSNQTTKLLKDTTNSSIHIIPGDSKINSKASQKNTKSTPPFTTQDWLENDVIAQTNYEPNDNDKIAILLETLLNKVESLSTELAATKEDIKFCKDVLRKFSAKKGYDKEWPSELKYKEHNLLDIASAKKSRYIRGVMAILFTEEELANGILRDKDSDKKSRSSKIPLDFDRLDILKRAHEIKYRIRDDMKKESWDKVITLGNSFCRDKRKEWRKKNKKKHNDSQCSDSSSQSTSSSKKSKTSTKRNKNQKFNESISSVKSSGSSASEVSSSTSSSTTSSNTSPKFKRRYNK